MAIVEEVDRRTKRTTLFCEGTVTAVYLNKLQSIKTYAGQKGKAWTPTHSVNIVVDGDKISLGLTDKPDNLRVKNADDQYVDFGKGLEITVQVAEGEEYNGKPQYSARLSDICVIGGDILPETKQIKESGGQSSTYSGKPKDNTGMQVGHALNVAFDFHGHTTLKGAIETAKAIHDLTVSMKADYKAAHPEMSDYDVGAAVGHAVQNAAKCVKAKGGEVDEIEAIALSILHSIVPQMTAYVKGEAPKAAVKAAKTKPEAQEAPQEDEAVQDSPVEEAPVEKPARAVKAKAQTKAPVKRTPKITPPPEESIDYDDIPF